MEAVNYEEQRKADFNERMRRQRKQTTQKAAENQAALKAKLLDELKLFGSQEESDGDNDSSGPTND